MIRTAFAAVLLVASPIGALAMDGHEQADRAIGAGERVGTERMVFETGVTGKAHDEFLRGLALLHNFEYARAAAAFRLAQEADPDWVMPYWGEAMTHNHPLWEKQDRASARAILERLGPTGEARALKSRSQRELEWLSAVETLYSDVGTKEERDHLYLAKMRALLASDPSDIDARAFTGLAVLGTSHGGRDIALYMEAAGLLEPGFMAHGYHPGILHYLIHSYDDPIHAPLGERMAQRYAGVAPDAGHAQHMVSHIYLALADWEATEKANVNASRVVNLQRAAQGRDPAYCGHYNEWLSYALLQQGKDASALIENCVAEVRDAAAAAKEAGHNKIPGSWSAARVTLFMGVDEGVWLDTIDFPEGSSLMPARFFQAHGKFLRYHASDMSKAKAGLAEMKKVYEEMVSMAGARDESNRGAWLVRAVERAEAIVEMTEGDKAAGMAALEEAAAAELALPIVFGPPVIFKPSYEILGEIHLAEGRKAEAAAAFEKSLKLAPGRRLSLAGLEAAKAL